MLTVNVLTEKGTSFTCVNNNLDCGAHAHIMFPYSTGIMKQQLITDFPGNPKDTVDNLRRTEGTKSPVSQVIY